MATRRRKTIQQITEQANRILTNLNREWGARKDFQRGIEAEYRRQYRSPWEARGYGRSVARTNRLRERMERVRNARDNYERNTARAAGYGDNVAFAAYKGASATREQRMGIASKSNSNT